MDPGITRAIYLHGFASSARSTKAQFFAERFAEVGVPLVAPDLNAPDFGTLTTTRMIDEVGTVLAQGAPGPVVLMGSSLGAFVAWHASARLSPVMPQHPIAALVLLAPALTFGRNRDEDFGPGGVDEWERTGTREVFHYGDNAPRQLHYEFYRDAMTYPSSPSQNSQPTLVFQGLQDTVVKPGGVVAFCEGRTNITLRLLPDDHQLLAHLDVMWQETRTFLGC
ncbi:MAG TPA: YqiA/YcfP family alpha/beta fold hydrolase [Luteitalea sp.]|nr:YqiA/YcfP family alpha/beta fold hydrolase [Luteitalea sp.]